MNTRKLLKKKGEIHIGSGMAINHALVSQKPQQIGAVKVIRAHGSINT